MTTDIRKCSNRPVLRLPTTMLNEFEDQLGQKIELFVSKNSSIIQPSQKIEYVLDSLVQGINENNRHRNADFGPTAGKELL